MGNEPLFPYSEFKRLNQRETNKSDVNPICENSLVGYILEVDVEYPDELHEMHNDYPLAPEKTKITHNNMLSKYCSDIGNNYDIKVGVVKLNMSFTTKTFSCINH